MIEQVKHKGLALAVLAAAQFMVILDATIVNVALPAIQKALNFSTDAQLQWIITAYALVFGGFLLLGGRLADLFGRRRIFMIGVALFAAASLVGGLSQSPQMLIALRCVQGFGGALLAPAALSLVLTIFKEGKERNRALGIWSMIAGGGGAVGLLLGGILTQYIDWRWIFFINVPIAIAVLLTARQYVPEGLPEKKQPIDYAGAVMVTASLMSLVYALAEAPTDGWGSKTVLGMIALAVVLMAAFLVNEVRLKYPLVELKLFRRRNISGSLIIQTVMPAALFGMFFYLSIYLQQILRYSPTKTGAADVPFTLILIVVAGVLSQIITKIRLKPILVAAPLIVGAGLWYFSRLPLRADYWTNILPGIVLMSIGMAVVFVVTTVVSTNGVSHEESGLVSGLLNVAQQIGGAIGLAVLSVVSTSVTNHDMLVAKGSKAAMPLALVHGFQRGFLVAALFTIIASAVALFLDTRKPTSEEANNEATEDAEALAAIPGV